MDHRRRTPVRRAPLLPLTGGLLAVALLASGCTQASTESVSATSSTSSSGATPPSTPTPAVTPTVTVTATVTETVTATVTTTKTVLAPAMGVLGPTGYQKLQLGMSYKDAMATGQLVKLPSLGWTVKNHPTAGVCVTKAGGLMAIFADKSAVTPEGIHVGSTYAQVKAAYPNVQESIDYVYVMTSSTTRYFFLIGGRRPGSKVYQWNINTTDQSCFN